MEFLKTNIDISHLSNFKTKAFTKYYYEINNISDLDNLSKIYNFCILNNLGFLIVGGGTNLLFAFDKFNGFIVKNNLEFFNYNEVTKILEVGTSNSIREVSEKLEIVFNNDLWHRFIGLPGSIGGAVFGNAGCFGLEMENNFLSAEIYCLKTGEIKTFFKDDMNFEYRESFIKNNPEYFIVSVKFDLSKKVEKYSTDVDNIKFREEVQPKGNSCGSFFKNPSKEFSAGYLIENVGLKGFHHNNAFFSEKHANFLMMSVDNGNYIDLLELINIAKYKVLDKFDIELVNEVRIIKN
ncbi:MAG: FAD-binding protein [Candidatus Gracilibacteria bacterium]|nr:FAD-binding protein [Candidatus Gracilibacteria bacterium]